MGRITAKIKLNQFYIRKQNDQGGKDEPYLLTLFARIDGTIADPKVPLGERVLPIHIPELLGHGDLGPDSKGMSMTGVNIVKVPTAIGAWETTLTSENLDMMPALMRQAAFGIGVVFLEEDSTLDSTIRAFLPEAKKEIHKLANNFLRIMLGWQPPLPDWFPGRDAFYNYLAQYRAQIMQSGFNPNGVIDGGALMDHVLAAVLPSEIGKAVGKALIPSGELVNIIAAIVQGTDRDELIGSNGVTFSFYDLVGRAHAPRKFEFDTVTFIELRLPGMTEGFRLPATGQGIYAVDGTVRRTDTDEPPILAALRGPGQTVTVLGRRLNQDSFQRNLSFDFGLTYKVDSSGNNFEAGRFRSGPAAASSADGKIQVVAGLGLDNEFWFAITEDVGTNWKDWKRISTRKTFKGAPSITLNLAGNLIYVVGRDADNFYWFSKSGNKGQTWDQWRRIGSSVFDSSPSMVFVKKRSMPGKPHENTLVVAGLGTDKRVWTTRFSDSESLSDQGWQPIRAGSKDHPTREFTSAPAMTCGIHENILLVCRASDLLYWRAESGDGGKEFMVGTVWQRFGKPDAGGVTYNSDGKRSGDLQDMYSAPAVVATSDTRLVLGLSPTLGLWRNQCALGEHEIWRPITQEPEPGFRMHYY